MSRPTPVDRGGKSDGSSVPKPPHLRDPRMKGITVVQKSTERIPPSVRQGSELPVTTETQREPTTMQKSKAGEDDVRVDGLPKRTLINPASLREELRKAVLKLNVPAQDWFDEPEIPTSAEVGRIVAGAPTGQPKAIHPNIIHGPWQSHEEYLKTLYGLFREDGIGLLRDCVDELRETPSLDEAASELKARIYESVYINGVTLCRKGLIFRVEFTTRRSGKRIHWPVSSRLKAGNMVALTPARDGFKTVCKVAVVVARPLVDLEVDPPTKPGVHIEFGNPNDIEIDPQQEWLMVEAPSSYWEAARHTLAALQSMRDEDFPLSKHVFDLETTVNAPVYTDTSTMVALATDANEKLTKENGHGLDSSQEAALKRILTKSLALVQGPPGTGKTYVSVVAVRLLLAAIKGAEGPIVVTAHTNHALDQLLRHIAQFEPEFVRLGGQSADREVIVPRTLPALREQQTNARKGSRAEPIAIEKQVRRDLDDLMPMLGYETPLPLEAIQKAGLLNETQCTELNTMKNEWDQAFNDSDDPISNFCTDQITPFKKRGQDYCPMLWEDIDDTADVQVEDADLPLQIEDDRWEQLYGKFFPIEAGFTPRFERYSEAKVVSILQEYRGCLKEIPDKYRGSIYEFFRQKILEKARDRLRIIGWDCKRMSQLFTVARWEGDYHILMGTKIIGMTTTGLSKYRPLVKALRPKIVLVEEAAETLEPSVAPAFMPSVEHVILVGDHQQLRGHCNLRDLEGRPFHLDVSLFERLVSNDVEFTKLNLQRRMRPEIREIIAPIYPDLADHASVLHRPNIPGMGGVNTCFVNHDFTEASDDQLSKINSGEATFVMMFRKYLIDNGIEDRRITILTFYNGQKKLLGRMLARSDFPKCRIVTVDSFQGEESDIVLLSMVRCNTQHQIGFLSVVNRVCVALSRARLGFFIFGHITDVYQRSRLWQDVCKILEARGTLFASLPLVCANHGTTTWAANGNVLQDLDGGCSKDCGGEMPCGHRCSRKCHPLSHDKLKCQEPCLSKLPCGHPCRYPCWSEIHACIPCTEQQKEEALEAKEKTFVDAQRALTEQQSSEIAEQVVVKKESPQKPRQSTQTTRRQPPADRGRRAYREFAANSSPPKAPVNKKHEEQKRQVDIETTAAALTRDRVIAAGSAIAALKALTLDQTSTAHAVDGTDAATRPRQTWTDTWFDPVVEQRARQLLDEEAQKEEMEEEKKYKLIADF